MYIKSVDKTIDNYNSLLQDAREGKLELLDTDCDTGRETSAAEYSLADKTYARLLHDLSRNNFSQMTPALRANLLDFYSNLNAPFHTKKHRKQWSETERGIQQLRDWRPTQESESPASAK